MIIPEEMTVPTTAIATAAGEGSGGRQVIRVWGVTQREAGWIYMFKVHYPGSTIC